MRQEINFKELIALFNKSFKKILIFVFLFTLCVGSLYFTISPSYEAKTDLLINYSGKRSESSVLQSNEIDMNLRLIETYKQMLKSDRMISKVNEKLEKTYSKKTIMNNIKIETSNNSQIITIVVTEKTPEAAALLANIYAQVFQEQVRELMNLENINILKEVSAETDVIMIKPSPILFYFVSLLIGILISIMTILIKEFHITNLNTVAKTEKILGITNLGIISSIRSRRTTNFQLFNLIQSLDKPMNTMEEFRILRANILFQMAQKHIKTIMVTSSNLEDGKTFISGNLAISMAMDGKKTLYVDADLRKPDGRKLFNLPERKGLTSTIIGNYRLEEVIQETSTDNLFFISSGPLPTNPAEILSSTNMKSLVEELKIKFDVIIFDTPPLIVTDAISLSSLVDGCLFVVDTTYTKEDMAKRSISSLTKVGANFLGSVLNRNNKDAKNAYFHY